MIKSKREMTGRIELDLTGPDGNAYSLLGYAKRFAEQNHIEWEPIREDMTSGGYEHLIEVFDKHFGDFVILYR